MAGCNSGFQMFLTTLKEEITKKLAAGQAVESCKKEALAFMENHPDAALEIFTTAYYTGFESGTVANEQTKESWRKKQGPHVVE